MKTYQSPFISICKLGMLSVALLLSSCATYPGLGGLGSMGDMMSPNMKQGAVQGGMLGAVVGGVIGEDREDVVRAAALGALAGAVAGAYSDQQAYTSGGYQSQSGYNQYPSQTQQSYGGYQNTRQQGYNNQQSAYSQYPNDFPYARFTERRGVVISPHAPYRKIDVSTYRHGQVVVDPTTNKAFRIPYEG